MRRADLLTAALVSAAVHAGVLWSSDARWEVSDPAGDASSSRLRLTAVSAAPPPRPARAESAPAAPERAASPATRSAPTSREGDAAAQGPPGEPPATAGRPDAERKTAARPERSAREQRERPAPPPAQGDPPRGDREAAAPRSAPEDAARPDREPAVREERPEPPRPQQRAAAEAPEAPPSDDVGAPALSGTPSPRVRTDLVRPIYPTASRRRGEEGVVLVEVSLARAGGVEGVRVADSSGHARLDRAALEAVERAAEDPRFVPPGAASDGPRRERFEIVFRFEP